MLKADGEPLMGDGEMIKNYGAYRQALKGDGEA